MMTHHMAKMTAKAAAELRGDPSAGRGGGAFTATPRIVLTITEPTDDEAGLLAMLGYDSEYARRLQGAKNNHGPKLEPMHLRLSLETIRLSGGKTATERAVRFDVPMVSAVVNSAVTHSTAANTAAGINNAARNLVLKIVDNGVVKGGHRLPLAASSRGATGERAAIPIIARELLNVHQHISVVRATAAAKRPIGELVAMSKIGGVVFDRAELGWCYRVRAHYRDNPLGAIAKDDVQNERRRGVARGSTLGRVTPHSTNLGPQLERAQLRRRQRRQRELRSIFFTRRRNPFKPFMHPAQIVDDLRQRDERHRIARLRRGYDLGPLLAPVLTLASCLDERPGGRHDMVLPMSRHRHAVDATNSISDRLAGHSLGDHLASNFEF
jgi:hypothetical protein